MEKSEKEKIQLWISDLFGNRSFEKLDMEFPDYDSRDTAHEKIFVNVIGIKNGSKTTFELVIKKNNEIILDTLNFARGYKNELLFYSEIMPQFINLAKENELPAFQNIPLCYGTKVLDDRYLILLENMKPKGFRKHTIERNQDINHARLVLEAYAINHAFSFALKDQKPEIFFELQNGISELQTGDETNRFLVRTIEKQLEFAIEFYRNINKPHIIERLSTLRQEYSKNYERYITNENEEYLVIKHGDCWNDNFLFHYNEDNSEPDQVFIVEWQTGGLASPVTDVIFYIFTCCSRKELENLDELLKLYHEKLSQTLKQLGSQPEKCFPWDVCLESFKKYVSLGISMVPVSARMSQKHTNENYTINQAFEDGDFRGVFSETVSDPRKYFDRINGIFELCILRGYL